MHIDPAAEYSHWSEDELLHLASERHSLTVEGASALDAELQRRNLTEADRVEYKKFVKRQEHREWRQHRSWKIPTPGLKPRLSLSEILEAFAAMAVISITYIALPRRYHFISKDWQDAAVITLITSVLVAFMAVSIRTIAFWASLGVSSTIDLFMLHAITRRTPNLSRGAAKGAAMIGLLLFLAVYSLVRFLQGKLCGKGTAVGA